MTFKEAELLGLQKAINFEDVISEKKENNSKIDLLQKLSEARDKYVEEGLILDLHGKRSRFTFKICDQVNIESLLNLKKKGDKDIFYFANNEIKNFFTYEELEYIYKELYNNKLYNNLYYEVLSEYILNNINTSIMKITKDKIYYGYSNDEIIKRTDELYEQQKIY